ncbi:MAG: GDCCVxC domain-containing (seleno)protein [Gammaproteobacteria bacterium]|nr:GDCCVxC domain-containing (seleno)protein [Gammaproteobacteria bacterium]
MNRPPGDDKGNRRDAGGVVLDTTIECPSCGHRRSEIMPLNACIYFYPCKACGRLLRPRPGDCCVFCSYGTVSCPPKQQAGSRPGA